MGFTLQLKLEELCGEYLKLKKFANKKETKGSLASE
jgi:hypothetical protein